MIDSNGRQSLQSDNVLYWPDVQPMFALGGAGGPGLFPVEGVASVIEVKSTLTARELRRALVNLTSSCGDDLIMSSGALTKNEVKEPHAVRRPFGCILAFDSVVAIATLQLELRQSQAWSLVCVLGNNGGLYVAGDGIGTAEMCDNTIADAERLVTFSALLRDNIQDARVIRGTPGLASYASDSIDVSSAPL